MEKEDFPASTRRRVSTRPASPSKAHGQYSDASNIRIDGDHHSKRLYGFKRLTEAEMTE